MYWLKDTYALPYVGSPIRTSAGLWICAPHRSFSQLITSFFGSQCQGIPLMLLLTWPLTACVSVQRRTSSLLSVSELFWFLNKYSWWIVTHYFHSLSRFVVYLFSLGLCYSIFKVLLQDLSCKWWRIRGSNPWPPACKAGALPAELIPHKTHSADH